MSDSNDIVQDSNNSSSSSSPDNGALLQSSSSSSRTVTAPAPRNRKRHAISSSSSSFFSPSSSSSSLLSCHVPYCDSQPRATLRCCQTVMCLSCFRKALRHPPHSCPFCRAVVSFVSTCNDVGMPIPPSLDNLSAYKQMDEYAVKSIAAGWKTQSGQWNYRVVWKPTNVSQEYLTNCRELVLKFHKKNGSPAPSLFSSSNAVSPSDDDDDDDGDDGARRRQRKRIAHS